MPHGKDEHGIDADSPDCMSSISPLREGNIPAYIGKPHYLLCDGDFKENSAAAEYDAVVSKHDSYIDVEPRTGRVVDSSERWQVYLRLQANILYTDVKQVMYEPYIIIDKTKDIGKAGAEELSAYLERVSVFLKPKPRTSWPYLLVSVAPFL